MHLVGFHYNNISRCTVLWMSNLFRSFEGTRYSVGLLKTNCLPRVLTQHAFLLSYTQINDLAVTSQSRNSSPLWWPTGRCFIAKLFVFVVCIVRSTLIHLVHSLKVSTNAYFIDHVLPSLVHAFLINFMDSTNLLDDTILEILIAEATELFWVMTPCEVLSFCWRFG